MNNYIFDPLNPLSFQSDESHDALRLPKCGMQVQVSFVATFFPDLVLFSQLVVLLLIFITIAGVGIFFD